MIPRILSDFRTNPGFSARRTEVIGLSFGLHKSFEITEGRAIEFRAEAFNLFNRTNFSSVSSTNSNGGGFGVFNSTLPARQLQLALRLVF